ncbi:uncharacterized protein LOC142568037 isoform X1 [Dermacentor variabilis]|uniref:uncharacterized protein LOC142568037 isoform X1 n=1 Tax=Dermacentor variabilis TaxID=34621 RepID=UPI003F5BB38E
MQCACTTTRPGELRSEPSSGCPANIGSLEVEGDSGRPQHEQHLSLLDNFSQAKWQLEQLLDADGDLAQLDGKLQELQMITAEVASHLPAASLRWV